MAAIECCCYFVPVKLKYQKRQQQQQQQQQQQLTRGRTNFSLAGQQEQRQHELRYPTSRRPEQNHDPKIGATVIRTQPAGTGGGDCEEIELKLYSLSEERLLLDTDRRFCLVDQAGRTRSRPISRLAEGRALLDVRLPDSLSLIRFKVDPASGHIEQRLTIRQIEPSHDEPLPTEAARLGGAGAGAGGGAQTNKPEPLANRAAAAAGDHEQACEQLDYVDIDELDQDIDEEARRLARPRGVCPARFNSKLAPDLEQIVERLSTRSFVLVERQHQHQQSPQEQHSPELSGGQCLVPLSQADSSGAAQTKGGEPLRDEFLSSIKVEQQQQQQQHKEVTITKGNDHQHERQRQTAKPKWKGFKSSIVRRLNGLLFSSSSGGGGKSAKASSTRGSDQQGPTTTASLAGAAAAAAGNNSAAKAEIWPKDKLEQRRRQQLQLRPQLDGAPDISFPISDNNERQLVATGACSSQLSNNDNNDNSNNNGIAQATIRWQTTTRPSDIDFDRGRQRQQQQLDRQHLDQIQLMAPRQQPPQPQSARLQLLQLQQQQQHCDSPPARARQAHEVMISYNHREAQEYAIKLRSALDSLGVGVYLDLFEIQNGADWQDSLNWAILDCRLFVALVTPSYGSTLWTRRECKLADLLGKRMVPISFLPDSKAMWPPASLAIQFATIQYIEAGTLDAASALAPPGDRLEAPGWRAACWPDERVRTIAQQIRQTLAEMNGHLAHESACEEDDDDDEVDEVEDEEEEEDEGYYNCHRDSLLVGPADEESEESELIVSTRTSALGVSSSSNNSRPLRPNGLAKGGRRPCSSSGGSSGSSGLTSATTTSSCSFSNCNYITASTSNNNNKWPTLDSGYDSPAHSLLRPLTAAAGGGRARWGPIVVADGQPQLGGYGSTTTDCTPPESPLQSSEGAGGEQQWPHQVISMQPGDSPSDSPMGGEEAAAAEAPLTATKKRKSSIGGRAMGALSKVRRKLRLKASLAAAAASSPSTSACGPLGPDEKTPLNSPPAPPVVSTNTGYCRLAPEVQVQGGYNGTAEVIQRDLDEQRVDHDDDHDDKSSQCCAITDDKTDLVSFSAFRVDSSGGGGGASNSNNKSESWLAGKRKRRLAIGAPSVPSTAGPAAGYKRIEVST